MPSAIILLQTVYNSVQSRKICRPHRRCHYRRPPVELRNFWHFMNEIAMQSFRHNKWISFVRFGAIETNSKISKKSLAPTPSFCFIISCSCSIRLYQLLFVCSWIVLLSSESLGLWLYRIAGIEWKTFLNTINSTTYIAWMWISEEKRVLFRYVAS